MYPDNIEEEIGYSTLSGYPVVNLHYILHLTVLTRTLTFGSGAFLLPSSRSFFYTIGFPKKGALALR